MYITMNWSIILCFVYVIVIPSQGDSLRRFSTRDFAKPISRDYFKLRDSKHHSHSSPSERTLLKQILLDVLTFLQVDSKKHRKSNDLPNILRDYRERRLRKFAGKRRSTLSLHSEEVKERLLPRSEPARPGHTLIKPTKTMLKSAAKYPRTDGVSLVYGNLDNLGIVHGKTPYRILYSDFRKANLLELLKNLLKEQFSVGSLRRSSYSKPKLREKSKNKSKSKKKKHQKEFKKTDTMRAQIYHSEFESSNEMYDGDKGYGLTINTKHFKNKRKPKYYDQNISNESKDTDTRAFQSSMDFGKHKKKSIQKSNKKKKMEPTLHNNEKLNEKLEKKLQLYKLKKRVPLESYKKRFSKKLHKKRPGLNRQQGNEQSQSIERSRSRYSREPSSKYRYSKTSLEDSYSREYKSSGYKKYNKREKKFLGRSKKKRISRQRDSKEKSEIVKHDKENKNKKEENTGRLVYGSPDNYGIVWGKTPYRTVYTDFRKTSNMLSKILEAYHNYKRKNNLKKALVAIKVWPLKKTKMNRENLNNVQGQVLSNNPNEIMDDESIEIDAGVLVGEDFRKQRRKSHHKVKSAFRNRDENYDNDNETNKCDDSAEKESSDESDYEKNPGNPYTLFKNKYKQNWPWHYEMGDHINLNPFGPQFANQGPSGASLFFNRKWWYFNQDDFIPFR